MYDILNMMILIVMVLFNDIMVTKQNVITLPQGQFRGEARNGYVSYMGIPYATIPNPEGRFMKAGLAPIWSNIKDSSVATCSTTSAVNSCLVLDVYTPTASGDPWPVLVWVTGGTGPYNPGKLVQQGIIVVIVHHRIGPLGFMCLGDERIPGNAGIKDVVTALRWVQDNIIAFKGNSANVVIGGQGFGAAIVDAITLSSTATGLYHGVILQSGTAIIPWAFNYDAEERAKTVNTELNEDLVKYLLETKTEELVANSNNMEKPYFPFCICVEKPSKKAERLIPAAPYELLISKNNNITPMIIGFNSNEAYVFVSLLRQANVLKRILSNMNFILPDEFKFLSERERRQAMRQVKDIYFKNNITMASVLVYHRDAYFSTHVHRSVRRYSSLGSVYYYQFSHSGELGVQPESGLKKNGAAHSDELAYLFYDADLEGRDGEVQKQMLKLWSNFVKYLNPTPSNSEFSWEATKPDNFKLLNIGAETKMMDYPYSRVSLVWDSIYDKYYYTRNRVTN